MEEEEKDKKRQKIYYIIVFTISSVIMIMLLLVVFHFMGIIMTRIVAGIFLCSSIVVFYRARTSFDYRSSFYPMELSMFLIGLGVLLWPLVKLVFKIG